MDDVQSTQLGAMMRNGSLQWTAGGGLQCTAAEHLPWVNKKAADTPMPTEVSTDRQRSKDSRQPKDSTK